MNTLKSRGHVALVGAGPGDPQLLTLQAVRLLESADAVVYDRLVNTRILEHVPPGCRRIYAGKSAGNHTLNQAGINRLLISLAKEGFRVVRLKGGDPFVFGRGGEEAEVLSQAGVSFEIVPGISAGIAAPAYAGIPVTHRGLAGTVTIVTGHLDPESATPEVDFTALAQSTGTLVFFMGARSVGRIARSLIRYGMAEDTPVAVVENATTPRQRVQLCRLSEAIRLAEREEVAAPAVIVVGKVAALADNLAWFLPELNEDPEDVSLHPEFEVAIGFSGHPIQAEEEKHDGEE